MAQHRVSTRRNHHDSDVVVLVYHMMEFGIKVHKPWVSESFPVHSDPPWAGVGLLQLLVRVWFPGQQFLEQAPQSSHPLQDPSTVSKLFEKFLKLTLQLFTWTGIIATLSFGALSLTVCSLRGYGACSGAGDADSSGCPIKSWLHILFGIDNW